MKYVYIVGKHCKPLMPTTRFGHVRKLLKEKKAVPICNSPFTIKLKYDVPGYTQPVYEGIDTGRENIGDAASLRTARMFFWQMSGRTTNPSRRRCRTEPAFAVNAAVMTVRANSVKRSMTARKFRTGMTIPSGQSIHAI